mgnify:CR=1 FL=1
MRKSLPSLRSRFCLEPLSEQKPDQRRLRQPELNQTILGVYGFQGRFPVRLLIGPRPISLAAIAILCGCVLLNVLGPLTGAAAVLQYPGCWIRDQFATEKFDLSAQDAANLAVYNKPILQRIDLLEMTQSDLRARLSRLRAERAAFPTLLETARIMCQRSMGCDVSSIGAQTLLNSPVLASRKSLEMVDAGLVQTQADLDTARHEYLATLETLLDTRNAQHRLRDFSRMPDGCKSALATERMRKGAASLGISVFHADG